jgi:hypothetical protein
MQTQTEAATFPFKRKLGESEMKTIVGGGCTEAFLGLVVATAGLALSTATVLGTFVGVLGFVAAGKAYEDC